MRPTKAGPELVQVIYDVRTGMLAFFSDGTVAEAKYNQRGDRTWKVTENIVAELRKNSSDPFASVVAEPTEYDADKVGAEHDRHWAQLRAEYGYHAEEYQSQYDNDPSPYDGTYSEE